MPEAVKPIPRLSRTPVPFVPAAALLAALTVAGCGSKAAERRPRVPVTVAAAVSRDMPFALIATGAVEATETADVGSHVGDRPSVKALLTQLDAIAQQPAHAAPAP